MQANQVRLGLEGMEACSGVRQGDIRGQASRGQTRTLNAELTLHESRNGLW